MRERLGLHSHEPAKRTVAIRLEIGFSSAFGTHPDASEHLTPINLANLSDKALREVRVRHWYRVRVIE